VAISLLDSRAGPRVRTTSFLVGCWTDRIPLLSPCETHCRRLSFPPLRASTRYQVYVSAWAEASTAASRYCEFAVNSVQPSSLMLKELMVAPLRGLATVAVARAARRGTSFGHGPIRPPGCGAARTASRQPLPPATKQLLSFTSRGGRRGAGRTARRQR